MKERLLGELAHEILEAEKSCDRRPRDVDKCLSPIPKASEPGKQMV
jgi:hypothetical protein